MAATQARRLRQNLTDAEARLWSVLRRRHMEGHHFRRQAPIGPYIADFVCFAENLIIEVDGGQHAEATRVRDEARTRWLEAHGFRVIRFWNHDVLANTEGVAQTIRRVLRREESPVV